MPTWPPQYNLHNSTDFGESKAVTRADVGIGHYKGGLFDCFAE